MTDRSTATLGIDLAAQAANTAMCRIDWNADGTGYVHCPGEGATDLDMITMIMREDITRVGIDAPFGWPVSFIEAVTAYREAGLWPDLLGDDTSQNEMRFRATDRAVRTATKLVPLSVSSDRIAVAAMRCARLLAAVQANSGTPIDRTGYGRLVEVYPAAALVRWGLSPKLDPADPGSYKGNGEHARARRDRLIDALAAKLNGWLEVPEKAFVVCRDNDDCLDAVLCALVARAAEVGAVDPVDDLSLAAAEGWIALPGEDSLKRIAARSGRTHR